MMDHSQPRLIIQCVAHTLFPSAILVLPMTSHLWDDIVLTDRMVAVGLEEEA